jgi:glycosyltransferase involved in cell wall biosynthesis
MSDVVAAGGAAGVAISVVICTLNPRPDFLHLVLEALKSQDLPTTEWELLLVDNASVQPLMASWDLSWHPHGRHVREERPGLTAARIRGIEESRADMLVFVDDDNVLAPDYLRTARAILRALPHIGVIGAGTLEGEFEVAPAPELVPYLRALSIRCVPNASWGNNTDARDTVPWGAGLCVTRNVASSYRPFLERLGVNELVDRRGDHLFCNGDVAFSWTAVTCDLGFGVFPQLRIKHLVAGSRVTQRYFLKLALDGTFSAAVLDYLWSGAPAQAPAGWIERAVRLCARGLRRGVFAMRYGWTVHKGAMKAHAYIREHRLRPIARDDIVGGR